MGTGGSSIALLLPVTGPMRPVSVGPDLASCAEAIGARLIQYVAAPLVGADNHVLMTDEEGLLVGEPTLNVRASWLAQQPIVGDVLIAAENRTGNLIDIEGPTYWTTTYTSMFEREGYRHG